MASVDQVKQQLQSVGAGRLLMMLIDTNAMATALTDDEQIGMVTQAEYNNATVVALATNTRLLIFGINPKKLLHTFSYGDLSAAEHTAGFSSGTVAMAISGRKVELRKVIDNKRSQALAEYLQARAGSSEPIDASVINSVVCPKCGSDQFSANKKGFGLGKAVVGGVLLGPAGLLGGFLGSGKVKVTCVRCGHSWEAGKA